MLLIILGCLAGLVGLGRSAPAQAAREAEVKAAYLYNFLVYVDWPKSAFAVAAPRAQSQTSARRDGDGPPRSSSRPLPPTAGVRHASGAAGHVGSGNAVGGTKLSTADVGWRPCAVPPPGARMRSSSVTAAMPCRGMAIEAALLHAFVPTS